MTDKQILERFREEVAEIIEDAQGYDPSTDSWIAIDAEGAAAQILSLCLNNQGEPVPKDDPEGRYEMAVVDRELECWAYGYRGFRRVVRRSEHSSLHGKLRARKVVS